MEKAHALIHSGFWQDLYDFAARRRKKAVQINCILFQQGRYKSFYVLFYCIPQRGLQKLTLGSLHAPTLIVKCVSKHLLKWATENEMKLTYCGRINRHAVKFNKVQIVISDFLRALLWFYAPYSGNTLPTFRDLPGQVGCPETCVRNCHRKVRNIPKERGILKLVFFVSLICPSYDTS